LFQNYSNTFPKFESGQYVEYLVDKNSTKFNVAKVVQVNEHILSLKVFCDSGESRCVLVSAASIDIFPVGWSQTNSIHINVPPSLTKFLHPEQQEISVPEDNLQKKDNNNTEKTEHVKSVLKGYWCPPIYFNHQCYSASFLRKQRLEALPQYIGPGPVRLVMREVLSRLVGSSFKSGAVLKKLEVSENRRPDFWLETMKGKSRVLLLEGQVEVPSRAEQITEFCREVCQKLECCPYLFGPVRVGGECPSACQTRPKHQFLLETSKSYKHKGRRGAGKKRSRKMEGQSEEKNAEDSSSDETESATPSTSNTRDASRECSPDRDTGILPPASKKLRTNHNSQQFKVEPTAKEIEEMEELIEESLREDTPSPPIRPPSPKLLRSRKPKAPPPSVTSPSVTPDIDIDAIEIGRGIELEAAFRYEDLPTPPRVMIEPPPLYRIHLKSNPLEWSADDVYEQIRSQPDTELAKYAPAFKHEQIDGAAFLLLNLPTILDHWRIKFSTAYNLCRLVEGVKLAFYIQFANHDIKQSKQIN